MSHILGHCTNERSELDGAGKDGDYYLINTSGNIDDCGQLRHILAVMLEVHDAPCHL